MPIVYNATDNTITVTGYTEAVPCSFVDLFNADKAGSLQLLAPTSASLDLSLSIQIKPADDKALKLNLIITNFSVIGTVTLTGLDKDGNAQTEDVSITGNGTYVTTKWFKSIDAGGIDCIGTYTIEITQSRWGVVWKEANTYILDARIILGQGTSANSAWLKDKNANIFFSSRAITVESQHAILLHDYSGLQYGTLDDLATKRTSESVYMSIDRQNFTNVRIIFMYGANTSVYLYSSILASISTTGNIIFGSQIENSWNGSIRIYNCIFDRVYFYTGSGHDIYNLVMSKGIHGLNSISSTTIDKISIYGIYYAISHYYYPNTIKNAYLRGNTWAVRWTGNTNPLYLINPDIDNWTISWDYTPFEKIFRQYEFDSHAQDKNGNPLSDVQVLGEYISPYGTAFDVTTNVNGDIATQIVDRSWYEQATGNTENLKTPLKVTYKKAGYQTVIKYYSLSEKIKDRVVMQRAIDIIFMGGHPVLNLDEDNPESEDYQSL